MTHQLHLGENGKVNQSTVQEFDHQLAERIPRSAKRDGTSLSQAAAELLQKGACLPDPDQKAGTVSPLLNHLIGSWSDDQTAELDAAPEEFEVVDEAHWR